MSLTHREFWTALHGMVLGAVFLLCYSGGLVALWCLRAEWLSGEGLRRVQRQLFFYTHKMAFFAWLAVLLGTWVIYPWYRAKPPAGADVAGYPKYLLLSHPSTSDWHEFGMEWKEHIAWLVPILATAVAAVASRYWDLLARDALLRRTVLAIYTLSFCCAAAAGLLGALINKAAPIR